MGGRKIKGGREPHNSLDHSMSHNVYLINLKRLEGAMGQKNRKDLGGGLEGRKGQEKEKAHEGDKKKKKKNDKRKYLHSCQLAKTAEKLSVIKALTASDSGIAPFCSGPSPPRLEFKTGRDVT